MLTCCSCSKTDEIVKETNDTVVPARYDVGVPTSMEDLPGAEALAEEEAAAAAAGKERELLELQKKEEAEAARRKDELEVEAQRRAALEAEATARAKEEAAKKEEANAAEEEADKLRTSQGLDWTITLEKPGAPGGILGLNVCHLNPKFLSITRVQGGAIGIWNSANPGKEVRTGDAIIEVNGIATDAAAMIKEMSTNPALRVTVRRVEEFGFAVDTSSSMGVRLQEETLAVTRVSPGGSFDDWNRSCGPGTQVMEGDVLIKADNVSGDPRRVLETLKKGEGTVQLLFRRGS